MNPKPDYGENSYRGSGKLQGKAAIITGGDSGIGRAVALAFAREGADVLIAYLNEESDAQETVRVVEKEGRKCIVIAGDIQQESHCQKNQYGTKRYFQKSITPSSSWWAIHWRCRSASSTSLRATVTYSSKPTGDT